MSHPEAPDQWPTPGITQSQISGGDELRRAVDAGISSRGRLHVGRGFGLAGCTDWHDMARDELAVLVAARVDPERRYSGSLFHQDDESGRQLGLRAWTTGGAWGKGLEPMPVLLTVVARRHRTNAPAASGNPQNRALWPRLQRFSFASTRRLADVGLFRGMGPLERGLSRGPRTRTFQDWMPHAQHPGVGTSLEEGACPERTTHPT
jgi:hypothetical protein